MTFLYLLVAPNISYGSTGFACVFVVLVNIDILFSKTIFSDNHMYFPTYAASMRGSHLALRIGLNGRLPRSLNCPHPFSQIHYPNPVSLDPCSLVLLSSSLQPNPSA